MICWIDLETTGLDEHVGHILEIGAFVTTDSFNRIGPSFREIVAPSLAGWEMGMDGFCTDMHTNNGLIRDVHREGRPLIDVENDFIEWFADTFDFSGDSETPMAGSSVHFDRRWLSFHAPDIEAQFTYQNFDVSSVGHLVRRIAPDMWAARPESRGRHRALPDLEDTLELVRYLGAVWEPAT